MCGEANFRTLVLGLWLLSVMWGLYVPLYCASLYCLTKKRTAFSRALSILSTLAFSLCTVDMIVYYLGAFLGKSIFCEYWCSKFTCFSCGVETTQDLREAIRSDLWDIVHSVTTLVVQFVCDAILIWRCYVIWNRNPWIVAFPIVCLLANTGVWVYVTYTETALYLIRLDAPLSEAEPPAKWLRLSSLEVPMSTVSFIMPVALNGIVTSLIVGRILWMTQDVNKFEAIWQKKKKIYGFMVSVLIESGALVVVAYVLLLTASYASITFYHIMQGFVTQIMGITPVLLLCLLSLAPPSDTQVSNPVSGRL